MKTTLEDGSTLLVILDCTREFSDVHTFLSYSVWFGFFCIILYVLIFAFLSKRAIAPFVKNLENQKRFITNASHELKTPLAIISVNAEAMEMMNGKNQWTEGIIKQVRRMSGLISHLILLSKAGEATRAQLQFLSFPVKDMFARLKEDFDLLAKDQGKKLTLSAEDGLTARSDEKYLSEILHILLDNAVKYCDDGGTILLSAEKGKRKTPSASPYPTTTKTAKTWTTAASLNGSTETTNPTTAKNGLRHRSFHSPGTLLPPLHSPHRGI